MSLERQVEELSAEDFLTEIGEALGDETLSGYAQVATGINDLQAKLDTAMGLMGEVSIYVNTVYSRAPRELADRFESFLNTTSTEGKDHE